MTVDAARHARVRALFLEAHEQPAERRAEWLSDICGDDRVLRAEVESLLSFDDEAPLIAEPGAAESASPMLSMAPRDESDPLGLVGHSLDDRYLVESFTAEGGFAYVYKAQHVLWRRPVAVKVFKRRLADNDELRRAFVKEGALLNELSRRTTAIVQSHDIGTFASPRLGPLLFTVLEWLDGRTLADVVALDPGPWSLARVLEILGPVAEALAVAHSAGIAHRDVKPRNIFLLDAAQGPSAPVVTAHGGHQVKLLDFGIAKVAAERGRGFDSTGGRLAAFTVDYAAPEQAVRTLGPSGPWTDVYSLAFVCAERLLGRHPYGDQDIMDVMRRLKDPTQRPTPGALGVSVSPAVEAVFQRALMHEPRARYAHAQEFWTALQQAAALPEAPLTSSRASPLERLRRWLRPRAAATSRGGTT